MANPLHRVRVLRVDLPSTPNPNPNLNPNPKPKPNPLRLNPNPNQVWTFLLSSISSRDDAQLNAKP